MISVTPPNGLARRRRVSRWAAGASALVLIVPTALALVNELETEFGQGETIESHEVVGLVFISMIALAIAVALIASALPSTDRPEVFLAAATGGVIAFGLLTFWFGGAYAAAAALAIVAWIAGRTAEGPSFARQLGVAGMSAVAVFVLYLAEGVLSDVVFESTRTSG